MVFKANRGIVAGVGPYEVDSTINVVGEIVYHRGCGSEMSHENGYWLCPCGYRYYGDPGRVPAPIHCLKCDIKYPAGLRSCPNCGMVRGDD